MLTREEAEQEDEYTCWSDRTEAVVAARNTVQEDREKEKERE